MEEARGWCFESWEFQIKKLQTFIWKEGEADLGFIRDAARESNPEAGYLISMWVAPEARLRGIGVALIDEVIEWARKNVAFGSSSWTPPSATTLLGSAYTYNIIILVVYKKTCLLHIDGV